MQKLLALYRAAIQYYKTEHAGRDAGHLPVDDRQDTQRPVDSGHLAAKDHALQLERDIVGSLVWIASVSVHHLELCVGKVEGT